MSLPQNIEPAPEPTPAPEPAAEETPLGGAPGDAAPLEEAAVEEPESPEEVASDGALRSWAKDNGIEDVPASGRLSASWRDQITAAMAAALDPKEEGSVDSPSTPESSTSSETMTETTTEEEAPVEEPAPVAPEFETGTYRSVFKAPNTFVNSQAFTS